MDALKAALANGADAVYLGASAFGARVNAGFDEEMLKSALRLAHLHRKKIYVTVNILIKETELASVRALLRFLSDAGADAVLVQDLGVLKICREEFPQLPVHASTQMALHNLSGAEAMRGLGVQRLVLARECGLAAIRQAAQTGMEVEVFCHGAMCVSVSGQCLFSSMIGGRSGNRGRCAQPCRLAYTYGGRCAAWLSPRDLCARDELLRLAQAGAYSFKIEGRLKRPEYVAVTTRLYRRALDALLEGRFTPADANEKMELTQIFSRGGFTNGYPGDAEDAGVIDETRVAPLGVAMGRIGKCYPKGGALLGELRPTLPLHNGDGLEIGGQAMVYSGPPVPAGGLALLRLRDRVQPGAPVRRTEDESQLAAARATYTEDALNAALPVYFDARLTAYPGKPAVLTLTDGESAVSVTGEACQAAQKKPLDAESAGRALGKLGGTPFRLRSLSCDSAGAFLSAAALNALRREGLERLAEARIQAQPRPCAPALRFLAPERRAFTPRLLVQTQRLEEVNALLSAGADEALFLPEDYRSQALEPMLSAFPEKTRLILPAQCREESLTALRALAERYRVPLAFSSPGQWARFSAAGMAWEGIPVMNGEAVVFLAAQGLRSAFLSRELSRAEIALLPRDQMELILPVYGRARLMLLNHCPMRTAMHLDKGREACALCEKGKGARGTYLTDRMNAAYPLMPMRLPEGCLIGLYAPKPLHLSGLLSDARDLSWQLNFTLETPEERLALTAHYAALLRGEDAPPVSCAGTVGRFLEGVR